MVKLIDYLTCGDVTRCRCREIDIATAGRLRDAIEPHMGPKQTIILDFSEVEFMDSSCLKVLVGPNRELVVDASEMSFCMGSGAPIEPDPRAGTHVCDRDSRCGGV
jgi:hypothetical protein